MTTMLVWLLIVANGYGYDGNTKVIERFADSTQCQHVLQNLPRKSGIDAKCVQANILVPK